MSKYILALTSLCLLSFTNGSIAVDILMEDNIETVCTVTSSNSVVDIDVTTNAVDIPLTDITVDCNAPNGANVYIESQWGGHFLHNDGEDDRLGLEYEWVFGNDLYPHVDTLEDDFEAYFIETKLDSNSSVLSQIIPITYTFINGGYTNPVAGRWHDTITISIESVD